MLLFTSITKQQYDDLIMDRCMIKGRVEVKRSGNIIAVKLRKEYSASNCKTIGEAKRLFFKILNGFNK